MTQKIEDARELVVLSLIIAYNIIQPVCIFQVISSTCTWMKANTYHIPIYRYITIPIHDHNLFESKQNKKIMIVYNIMNFFHPQYLIPEGITNYYRR